MIRLSMYCTLGMILLLWPGMVMAGRYVLETDPALAQHLREPGLEGDLSLLKSADSLASLRPLFHPPSDPVKEAIWSRHGLDCWFVVEAESASLLLAKLEQFPGVLSLREEFPDLTGDVIPDDYGLHDLWHLDALQMPEAWDLYHGRRRVTLAVIDAGFDIYHADLAANILINTPEDLNRNGVFDATDIDGIDNDGNGWVDDIVGYDFVTITESYFQVGFEVYRAVDGEDYGPADPEVFPDIAGHGTHVAGCAGAFTNNSKGVASPAWNVDLMPLRAAFTCENSAGDRITTGWATDFAEAIYYAANNGAQVITFSYSRLTETPTVHGAIRYASDLGILVFASAGNRGFSTPAYPAAYPEVIAVTALDQNLVKPDWATYGPWVELCAPGVDIWSTMSRDAPPGTEYFVWSGTSMATPLAASVAALTLASNPSLQASDVRTLLSDFARPVLDSNPGLDGQLGAGIVNAYMTILEGMGKLVSPEGLVVRLDDPSGIADLSWDFSDPGYDQTSFDYFEILRDGVAVGHTTREVFSDQLEQYGYHSYRVDAVYAEGERRSTSDRATFWIGPYGARPEIIDIELMDSQFGQTRISWSRGKVQGNHEVREICYDSESEIVAEPIPALGSAMRITPLAPCRLLQVRFWANIPEDGVVYATIHPWDGITPQDTILAEAYAELKRGTGWRVVDFYGQSVALTEDVVVRVQALEGTEMELGRCEGGTDRAWFLGSDGHWHQRDGMNAIRALIAVRDDQRHALTPPDSDRYRDGKLDGLDDPWCTYSICQDHRLVGTTLDTTFTDFLRRTGSTTYTIKANYANEAESASISVEATWLRGTEAFHPVEPTDINQTATVAMIRVDDRIPDRVVEVGVFDGELCVGAIRIAPDQTPPYQIALWQEDVENSLPGYQPGHKIEYRVWQEGMPENQSMYVFLETGADVFGASPPKVHLYSYRPRPPSNFSIQMPNEELVIAPGDVEPIHIAWSFADDPDPFEATRYDLLAHLTSHEQDTLLLVALAQRTYTDINLPVLAGIGSWSDTLSAEVWIEAVSPPDRVRSDNTVRIHFLSADGTALPLSFDVEAPYPNPFNAQFRVGVVLPERGEVRLELFDLLGRRLYHGTHTLSAGHNSLVLGREEMANLPGSGVLFLRTSYHEQQQVQKLVHIK